MTNPNDDVIAEFRANSGSVTQVMGGALAHLELILLHHLGRSSGKPYITPVAHVTYSGDYLLLGSFAGAPSEPQWVKNIENATELTVEMGTGTATMAPGSCVTDRSEAGCTRSPVTTGPSRTTTNSRPPGPSPSSA
jgi:deazaflavin-dependent oxidoreductase (nitroreductase family)